MTGDAKSVASNDGEQNSRDHRTWQQIAQKLTQPGINPDGNAVPAVPLEAGEGDGSRRTLTFADVVPKPGDYATEHAKYEKELDAYWERVDKAKSQGEFITDFPPFYEGPPKPPGLPGSPAHTSTLPTISDMLGESTKLNRIAFGAGQPDFSVNQIGEDAFKQRYAEEAARVGKQLGLTKPQVEQVAERLFEFETGGWGHADTLSGMTQKLALSDDTYAREHFHPASTAIGYNQLLMMTTMREIDQHGGDIADRLSQMATEDPARASELNQKAQLMRALGDVVHKELLDFAKANPGKSYFDAQGNPKEALYADFANSRQPTATGLTGRELAEGLHALNIDGDVGPIIQAECLGDEMRYAQQHNFGQLLDQRVKSMNDGAAAYDALRSPEKAAAMDEVFSQIKPPPGLKGEALREFEDAMQSMRDRIVNLPAGTNNDLARKNLSIPEARMLGKLLDLRKFGQESGKLSANAQALLDKIWASYLGNTNGSDFLGAAVELSNLAGGPQADAMLQPRNADLPTVNFFSRAGYDGNGITNRRTASELLFQIQRIMVGPRSDDTNPGVKAFIDAFQQVRD